MVAVVPSADMAPWKRIARNASSLLLSGAAGEVLNTYAIALSALALGPSGFGKLSAAQAFMDPFETLAGFGLVQVTIAAGGSRGSCDGTMRGTLLTMRFAFACVAIAAAFGAAFALGRREISPLLALLAISSLTSPLQNAANLPFQCDQAMHRLISVPFLVSVLRFVTSYVAYWFLCSPIGFQSSATIATAFSALATIIFARHYYRDRLKFDRSLAVSLFKSAWPIAVMEVIVMLYCRGSYMMLHKAGPAVQGEFAAADRLVKPILTLAGAIVVSALPTIAAMAGKGQYAEMLRAYKRSCLRIAYVLVPIIVIVWSLMPLLLRRFAPEYAGASTSFRILAVGAIFMFLNQLSSAFIISLGQFRLIMTISFANLVVYFASASYLIPRYAAPGAAVATGVTESVNSLMQSGAVAYLLVRAIKKQSPSRRVDVQ